MPYIMKNILKATSIRGLFTFFIKMNISSVRIHYFAFALGDNWFYSFILRGRFGLSYIISHDCWRRIGFMHRMLYKNDYMLRKGLEVHDGESPENYITSIYLFRTMWCGKFICLEQESGSTLPKRHAVFGRWILYGSMV